MRKQTIQIELSKTIGFIIKLNGKNGGTIESCGLHHDETSEIEELFEDGNDYSEYESQIDTIESLILAHAIAGVDVNCAPYRNGIQTVLDKIENL